METTITAVVAAAAIASALFVWFQVREMKRQTDLQRESREAAEQPYVWADVDIQQSNGWMLELIIGNSGPTVATNVRVRIEPPFKPTREREMSEVLERLASSGLSSLAPGRRLFWTIGPSPDLVTGEGPFVHVITIDCDGPFGSVPTAQYVIDMAAIKDSVVHRTGSMYEVSKAIDGLTKEFKAASKKADSRAAKRSPEYRMAVLRARFNAARSRIRRGT